jgi:uncharacterized protein YegL
MDTIPVQANAMIRSTLPTGQTIIQGALRRPAYLNQRQRILIVRDRSSSMNSHSKAADAEKATRELIAELNAPSNGDAFEVSIVDFNESAIVTAAWKKASAMSDQALALAPAGETSISAGLSAAQRQLDQTEPLEIAHSYLRPVVLIFSDGNHNSGADPITAANDLKKVADIVTVAFGHDADEEMLRRIASTPQHSVRCATGAQLRSFFAVVGKTLTQTRGAGRSATQALAMIALQQ